MTPRRWLDDESDATSDERELLRAALDTPPPAFAEQAVWRRLSVSLGVPNAGTLDTPDAGAAAGPPAAAALPHAGSTVLSTFLKGVALGVGVTAAAVGGQRALEGPAPATERAVQERPAATAAAVSSGSRTVPPLEPPRVEASERAAPPSSARAQRSAAPVDAAIRAETAPNGAGSVAAFPEPLDPNRRLGEEARLLRRARAELQAGSLSLAFATLEASRERFATPELAQEREALTIELLHKSGQRSAADERARAFLRRFPESPHAARVRGFVAAGP